jgi:hypothetical protein
VGAAKKTGPDGTVLITGLGAYQPLDFDFGKLALEDPLLQPALKGVRLVPRPGRTTVVDVAIVAMGEVYGTVYLAQHGPAREFGGATVELLDEAGKVVASAVSGMDGYFALTGIAPGRYQLRVAPDQLQHLGVKPAAVHDIDIPGNGAVLDGRDFKLEAR